MQLSIRGGRRAIAGPLVALLSLFGCSRDLAIPKAPLRAIGIACAADNQCEGGHCADGVCCIQVCAANETCNAAGNAGSCTARKLGDACTQDAQCPASGGTAYCVDGVCCESACGDRCHTCALAGDPGHCRVAQDNTDSRKQCGLCSACFSGVCAPALEGTDPNLSCPAGDVCGASQTCGAPSGTQCSKDTDCAVGDCVAGRCAQLTAERVLVDPMDPSAGLRVPQEVRVAKDGTVGILFDEWQAGTTDVSVPLENDEFFVQRGPSGALVASDLGPDLAGAQASFAWVGRSAFVARYQVDQNDGAPPDVVAGCNPGDPPPCGLYGVLIGPGGQVGRPEVIDPHARLGQQLRVVSDASGRLFAFHEAASDQDPSSADGINVWRRDLGPSGAVWTRVARVDPILVPADQSSSELFWSAEVIAGQPWVFAAVLGHNSTKTQLQLWRLPTATPIVLSVPDNATEGPCDVVDLATAHAQLSGGEGAVLSVECFSGWLTAQLVPAATGAPQVSWASSDSTFKLVLPLGSVGTSPTGLLRIDNGDPLKFAPLSFGTLTGGAWVSQRQLFSQQHNHAFAGGVGTLSPDLLPVVLVSTGAVTGSGVGNGIDLTLLRYHY